MIDSNQDPARQKALDATRGTETKWIDGLNMVIAFVSFLYVPFSMLASWLISPDWTFGDFMGLRPTLHNLWVFVSNTVYVIFAAMLIVVAIANIFGQSDSYAIKKMLCVLSSRLLWCLSLGGWYPLLSQCHHI